MVAAGGRSSARKATAGTKRKSKKKSHHHLNHRNPENLAAIISGVTATAQSFHSHNDLSLLPSQSIALESLIASTSQSLATFLSLLPKPFDPLTLSIQPPQHPESWFCRFLSATENRDSRWLHAFCMSEPSFCHLLDLLSPSLRSAVPQIAPDCALAAGIFRLAHGAAYAAVARRFGISPSDACRAFFAVCKAVIDNLGHLFELRTDSERVVVGFGWSSLPNCFGVLGLAKFAIESEILGKDGFLMVQALVDSEGRFLDVSAGWPSTFKPATILRQSKLFHEVEQTRELLQGPSYTLSDGSLIPQYVLGDSCFPLLPWLLTPYNRANEEDSFGSSDRAFNCAHGRAMELVGGAFGRLRSRWQLLSDSRRWKEGCVEYLPFVIVTGCLLHNFLVKRNEAMPDDKEVSCEAKGGGDDHHHHVAFDGMVDDSAVRIRDALAMHLSRVSLRG